MKNIRKFINDPDHTHTLAFLTTCFAFGWTTGALFSAAWPNLAWFDAFIIGVWFIATVAVGRVAASQLDAAFTRGLKAGVSIANEDGGEG